MIVSGKRFGLLPVVAAALLVNAFVTCSGVDAADRFDSSHLDAGLPVADRALKVYDSDEQHPLNRMHQMLFVADVVPLEINGALPRELEAGTDGEKPWYFRRRVGSEADRKLFGGDVRISPVMKWQDEKTVAFLQLAEQIQHEDLIEKLPTIQRLMFQWDVLSLWWRLEQKDAADPVVLLELAKLVKRAGMSSEEIKSVSSGWENARGQFVSSSSDVVDQQYFSSDDVIAQEKGWKEISRKSTQLFVAPQSLRSTRVFMKLPENGDLDLWMLKNAASKDREDKRPESRIETAMVLSLIGITTDLKPVASQLVDEIRFRTVYGLDETVDLAKTTTQDGSSLWVYFIDRQKTLETKLPAYRYLPSETQSVFLEYGTAKHATYAAQCSLCHRLTNSGNQTIAGVRSLSMNAEPRVEKDATYRNRLAEAQMSVVTERLAERLSAGAVELAKLKWDFRAVSKIEP